MKPEQGAALSSAAWRTFRYVRCITWVLHFVNLHSWASSACNRCLYFSCDCGFLARFRLESWCGSLSAPVDMMCDACSFEDATATILPLKSEPNIDIKTACKCLYVTRTGGH